VYVRAVGGLEIGKAQEQFSVSLLINCGPIAYVQENVDTRLIRANQSAIKILGIDPHEVVRTFGKSLVPDAPDAQGRLREVLKSIGEGTPTSGAVLELRRKDNGEPVWIQWWSKPASSGKYTRTMFIDVTDHVLMEQELERVGDTRTRKIDVRIVAATNRDLKAEVDAGRFREDLFYRLSVFPIQIPPLRERRADIPLLAAHFVKQSARRMNRSAPKFTPTTISQLASYDWPGNVRELQNAVERAVILAQGGALYFDLGDNAIGAPHPEVQIPTRSALLTHAELKRQERDNIVAALEKASGKVFGPGGAAELLGVKPTTLASRIKALGLNRKA